MTIELNIEGMSCGHCATGVRKALEAVSGVKNARVYLDEKRATVEGEAPIETLIAAVEDEGYAASRA